MWITKEELATHMKVDNIDVITESDDTIVSAAINGAVAEAKSYLTAYDVAAIFAAAGSSRHDLLLIFVKDIAVWHLLTLSNYQADLALREKRYDRAISWLKAVQKGDVDPDLAVTTDEYTAKITYGSNDRRENHF
jgi:phage gp36-like protein